MEPTVGRREKMYPFERAVRFFLENAVAGNFGLGVSKVEAKAILDEADQEAMDIVERVIASEPSMFAAEASADNYYGGPITDEPIPAAVDVIDGDEEAPGPRPRNRP
jgi:hypothetical protein